MAQQSSPFIKQLASSDRKTRTHALTHLRTYLSHPRPNAPFTPLDFLKLWKGLFYCMWMQDKPLHQQRLAQDFADLVDALRGEEDVLGWMEAFWITMGREWGNIDGLRMDKYLYLVRCHVGKGFEICARRDWASGASTSETSNGEANGETNAESFLQSYLSLLSTIPLSPRKPKIPNGLRHHVLDIYVDELAKVDRGRKAPVEILLGPVRRLGRETLVKSVRERVKEALGDERVGEWTGEVEGEVGGKLMDGVEGEGGIMVGGGHASAAADAEEAIAHEDGGDEEFGGFED